MNAPEKLTGAEVAGLVRKYRKASGSLRGLKRDHFGHHVNQNLASARSGEMATARALLKRSGQAKIAELLLLWHENLKAWDTDHAWSRSLADRINREVEAIQ